MFGDRCQGIYPMCEATFERTMLATAINSRGEHMALIQVKVIADVFTRQQKEEIVERLTDAMVAIEGENMRRTIWCLVEEVASGDWSVGGQTLTADDVKAIARS
jgi:4-oxalocrotonate tautomerase